MAQRCQLRVRSFLGHVTVATISCRPDPVRLAMSLPDIRGIQLSGFGVHLAYRRVRIAATAMDSRVRTVVTFESTAFNLAEPKNCFINPCCFGDDLAKWLIGELRKHGFGN